MATPNPFDQFDAQPPAAAGAGGGNPFDAFDENKGVPSPTAITPAHEDPALQAQWKSAGALDRLKMMVPWLHDNATQVLYTQTPAADIAKIGLQAGGTVLGGLAGGVTGPAGMIAGGMAGSAAGNYAGQKLDQQFNPDAQIKPGQVAGAALMGAVPGVSLAGAGLKTIGKEAVKYGLANAAGGAAESVLDENRIPTLGEAAIHFASGAVGAPIAAFADKGMRAAPALAEKALGAVRDATLKEGRDAGYMIPAVMGKLNNSMVNRVGESLSNRGDLARNITERNQVVTNELASKAIHLPTDEALSYQTIDQKISELHKPYQELAAVSPEAAKSLELYKQANKDKNLLWAAYNNPANARSGDPDTLKQYMYQKQLADMAYQDMELEASKVGKKSLMQRLTDAKVAIAKAYQVRNALNPATGNVDAPQLGRNFLREEPLTGELATIGKMNAAFPTFMRDADKVAGSGAGKSKMIESALAGYAGLHAAGPVGLLAAAAPFTDSMARNVLLSKAYQNSRLAQPMYATPRQDLGASFLRFAGQRAATPPLQTASASDTNTP